MAVAAVVEKLTEVWGETLARLRGQMTEATFNSALRGSAALGVEGRRWTIGAAPVALEWLEHRLRGQVAAALAGVVGSEVELVFVPLSAAAKRADNLKVLPASNGNGHGHAPAAVKLMSAYEVMTTDWPEPVWVIPGKLPAGLALLAGKVRIGKSWLALQICKVMATGGELFGERLNAGRFLYIALEDHPRRLRERMEKQQWPTEERLKLSSFMLRDQFDKQIGDLVSGGAQVLAEMVERQKFSLVVIDTLSRAIRGDQNDSDIMTMCLAPIQEVAQKQNCVVMVLDHHRKMVSGDGDFVGDILGSTAKGAIADTIWSLYRQRGQLGARLAMTSRDFGDTTLMLTADQNTGLWALDGNGDPHALELTERRQEILDALADLGRARVGEIAKAIEQNRGNTYSRLQDLVNAGLVARALDEADGGVWYTVTG